MTIFWACKTPTWSKYYARVEYLSDPSVDLLERFKEDIITYKNPIEHPAYVKCTNVQESEGHILFMLDSRVEIMVKPDEEEQILYFISCEDNQ